MRIAPLLAAFAIAAGLVGLSAVTGQPPPGKADKSPPAELVKFRGDWSVTKIDFPPELADVPSDELAKVLKAVSVAVAENRVTVNVRIPGQQQQDSYLLLKVDPAQTPAHIDLTEATAKFEPRRTLPTALKNGKVDREPLPIAVLKGIYKFEGDGLVLAFPSEPELDRPTAFKTVGPKNAKGNRLERAGVGLVYLSKKK
jgi:uncharacterized protein (TIGR03067 family)